MTQQITVGRFKVTWLLDGNYPCGPEMMPEAGSAVAQAIYLAAGLSPQGPSTEPFYAFAIEWDGHLWLIDAGCGVEEGPERGKVLQELHRLELKPEDVEGIIITHLHKDHTGGLLTPEGNAAFPNARIIVGQTEMAFWADPDMPRKDLREYELNRILMHKYSGRIETVADDAELVSGIRLEPLQGHSPGHSGVRIKDNDTEFLTWGDVMHSSVIQFDYPAWSVVVDMDPTRAVATRLELLERLVGENTLVAGSHTFGVGKVRRGPVAYQLVAD
jgi:glyoxylase-like metal-dependent hydrolase (beta-lactamase superfamily II)